MVKPTIEQESRDPRSWVDKQLDDPKVARAAFEETFQAYLDVCAERDALKTELDRLRTQGFAAPCPTCVAPLSYEYAHSTFGPCPDGKWHDIGCPVARDAMRNAKWPCGRPKYPELVKDGA